MYLKSKISLKHFNYLEKELLNRFNSYSMKLGGKKIKRLEDIHNLKNIYLNLENYKKIFFELFTERKTKEAYVKFAKLLIKKNFNGNGYFQKTPTIRIHLKGLGLTGYHCDYWYGHGENAITIWKPLTNTKNTCSLYVQNNKIDNKKLLTSFRKKKIDVAQINQILKHLCKKTDVKRNEYLQFNSKVIHGTQKNKENVSRISFDFRIIGINQNFGSKPKENFNQVLENKITKIKSHNKIFKCSTYTNGVSKIAVRNQIIFINSMCMNNNFQVILNDSEIYQLDYLPVLRGMIKNKNLDLIVVYSLKIFKNKNIKNQILKLLKKMNKKIYFCYENLYSDELNNI